jgi:hypothetical protein
MAIVVLEQPLDGKIGVNPDSVTKVTREAGRVFVWQGAQRLEVIGSFEQIVKLLNAKP